MTADHHDVLIIGSGFGANPRTSPPDRLIREVADDTGIGATCRNPVVPADAPGALRMLLVEGSA